MKVLLADVLICPSCLPREKKLIMRTQNMRGEEIVTGSLRCPQCATIYPIRKGVARLLPAQSMGPQGGSKPYESSREMSSYLWAHYGDCFNDKEANSAYSRWASLVTPASGPCLDVGCAAGRLTFELSGKFDLVIGVDRSVPFVQTARKLRRNGRLRFSLVKEGLLSEYRTITLPAVWYPEKVDFIVADTQALPFPGNFFSAAASLNLLDKVRLPIVHLSEVNRVARDSGAQLLFSDPFSWSGEVAPPEDWLGGVPRGKGAYPGEGFENVAGLLTKADSPLAPPWQVEQTGQVWWKIRNHRNHFELIRSLFLKAVR